MLSLWDSRCSMVCEPSEHALHMSAHRTYINVALQINARGTVFTHWGPTLSYMLYSHAWPDVHVCTQCLCAAPSSKNKCMHVSMY